MAKIHRFIGDFNLNKKELEITGETAHQIIKVLKLKVGEKIELSDGKGISAIAEIVEIGENTILVKKAPTPEGVGVPTASVGKNFVTLFCSILKKENFELVVQKTTECGISKIIPIITSRTIKTGLNLERLKKIAKEASEQSGRTTIPEVKPPCEFKESLELIKKEDSNILFDISGKDFNSLDNFQFSTPNQNLRFGTGHAFNLFIGPEGGWTPEEIEKAKSLNFKIASLGPLTLRGETAAIIVTYLISNLK